MDRTDWAQMVLRMAEHFPHQQIDQTTAQGWYDDQLHQYTAEQVARALARCVGTVKWLSCSDLVQAITDENRERSAVRSTTALYPARGAKAPPELAEIRRVLERAKSLPGSPDYLPADQVRPRIDELIAYHDARLAEGTP